MIKFNINIVRKIGMVYFIFGIGALMSSKITGIVAWESALLFFLGLFLYFQPDKEQKAS